MESEVWPTIGVLTVVVLGLVIAAFTRNKPEASASRPAPPAAANRKTVEEANVSVRASVPVRRAVRASSQRGGIARLILATSIGAVVVGVPFTLQYQSLSSKAADLEDEVSDMEQAVETAEAEAQREATAREEAEEELKKLERETESEAEEVLAALEEASALIGAQRAHILDLEAQLIRARRRPSGITCTDGISSSELVDLEMDPCSEWSFDY